MCVCVTLGPPLALTHGRAAGKGTGWDPVALIPPFLPPPPGDGRASQRHAFWARVCGVNAVLLMCVNIFFYTYFA